MSQPSGLLFDLRKFSIHDGPGIRTSVFFKGCPLRCAWCHNPESQSPYPELILHPRRCIGCGACEEACPQPSPPGPLSQRERGEDPHPRPLSLGERGEGPHPQPLSQGERGEGDSALRPLSPDGETGQFPMNDVGDVGLRSSPTSPIESLSTPVEGGLKPLSLKGRGVGVRGDFCDVCGACVEACYAEARQIVGRAYTVDEAMAVIESDRAFYAQSGGGVTFSGGEPLLQAEFLGALLRACKAAGLHTALDTCGEAPWERLEAVRADVDLFLYDLKLVDDERHRQATGVSNRRILDNLQRLSALGHTIALRLPLVPGLNDDDENLQAVARLAAGLPTLERIDLLAYHHTAENKYAGLGRAYPLPDTPAMPPERLEAIREWFTRQGLPVADPPR